MTPIEQQILEFMRSVDEVEISMIVANVIANKKTVEGYVRRLKTMGYLSVTKEGGLKNNHYSISGTGLHELQVSKGKKSYVGEVAAQRQFNVMSQEYPAFKPAPMAHCRNNGNRNFRSLGAFA